MVIESPLVKRREVFCGRSDSRSFQEDVPSSEREVFSPGKTGYSGSIRELLERIALVEGTPGFFVSKSQ